MRSLRGDLRDNEDFDSVEIDLACDGDHLALDFDRGRIIGELKTEMTDLKKEVRQLKKKIVLSIFDSKDDIKEFFSDI